MFKLVIVEDEDNIRHSLECFIPWEEMGFEVVNTFSDGEDALAYLKDHPCDALLTDILMSRMSGMEMIQKLHEIRPEIKVVILSGHSDFAYAQLAIQYKVVNYLVKPVDEDELIGVFRGIKEQLDFEKQEEALAEAENRELKQMLQKSFFRDLLSGRVTSENELIIYLKLLGINGISKECPLFAFEIRARRHGHDEAFSDQSGFFSEDALKEQFSILSKDFRCFVTEERNDHWRVVLIGRSGLNNEEARKHCNEQMQVFVEALGNVLTQEFAFHLTHSVVQIHDLLSGAKHTAHLSAALPGKQMDGGLCEAVVSDYKLLIVELDLGSKNTLIHILNRLLLDLQNTPLEDVRFILKNLYSLIELNYKKRKINVWDITNGKFHFSHLYSAENMESIANCLQEDFSVLCDALKGKTNESEHSVIGRIVKYLNEHIDEDIGHDVIAAKYRIHPGYLSRLFKQEMGETLSEYLLRIKIERAAELLKDGHYKVGEIAVMVGYSASSYFSVMFKKFTGYSPREYSQRVSL